MKLNEKIIMARKKAGMSQIDLADAMGVSRQSVSKWETGEANPEIGKLTLLANTLNCSVDWLLSESDEPLSDPSVESETRRDEPSNSYPDWVDHLPNSIGRLVKRFGWLYGLRVAASGLGFLLIGAFTRFFTVNAIKKSADIGSTTFDSDFFTGIAPVSNGAQDEIANTAANAFSIFAYAALGIGAILLIGGIVLAVMLKRWGAKEAKE